MARQNEWVTLPMGLNGPMDSRSRPADLGPGVLRYKLNFAINASGKLSRRAGFSALSFGLRSDSPSSVANWNFHRRGATREPITLLSEITSPDNLRYLFAGTSSRVSWLNNSTSEWTDIITDGTAGTRWQIAALRDKVVLTNNVDEPRIHTLGGGGTDLISELHSASPLGIGVTQAKVVVQYQNVILLMNVVEDGNRIANRIWWSDFRDAEKWLLADESISDFQDLDDGEQILNAAELGGVLYVFTDRSIWRLFPGSDAVSAFAVHRYYSEPKNRTACLAYENALVATGKELFWFGRNTIYWMNQFSPTPTSPDWLLRATGLVFEGDTRLDPQFCESPIGGFLPDAAGSSREIWFSYPRIGGDTGVNDYSIVLSFNTDSTVSPFTTADYVDHGFTAFCNFSRATDAGVTCNTNPVFIGASGADYCLKSIGGVFHREMVTLIGANVAEDIPDANYATTQHGYYSELMFLCPFPYDHRDKMMRSLTIHHDTVEQEVANLFRMRIGGSYILADPLATTPNCGVLWHEIDDLPAACPDVESLADLAEKGLRQDDATNFEMAEQARFLYTHLKIVAPNGEAPVGTDAAFSTISFDWLLLP